MLIKETVMFIAGVVGIGAAVKHFVGEEEPKRKPKLSNIQRDFLNIHFNGIFMGPVENTDHRRISENTTHECSRFYKFWAGTQVDDTFIVGRRDGKAGCFTVKSSGEEADDWSITYYEGTPSGVYTCHLNDVDIDEEGVQFEHNKKFKYLYLDMIDYMKRNKIKWH